MRLSILTGCLLIYQVLLSQTGSTDTSFKKNSVFVEVFGHNRGLFSVNYERLFRLTGDFIFYSARTGVGYTPGMDIKDKHLGGSIYLPIVFSVLAGNKAHYAQLGASYTVAFGHDFIDSTTYPPTVYQKFESAYIISLGYRYMRRGFMAQLFPLLQWTNNPSSKFTVGFGLSIGSVF